MKIDNNLKEASKFNRGPNKKNEIETFNQLQFKEI